MACRNPHVLPEPQVLGGGGAAAYGSAPAAWDEWDEIDPNPNKPMPFAWDEPQLEHTIKVSHDNAQIAVAGAVSCSVHVRASIIVYCACMACTRCVVGAWRHGPQSWALRPGFLAFHGWHRAPSMPNLLSPLPTP